MHLGCNNGANRTQKARFLLRCSPSSQISAAKLQKENGLISIFLLKILINPC